MKAQLAQHGGDADAGLPRAAGGRGAPGRGQAHGRGAAAEPLDFKQGSPSPRAGQKTAIGLPDEHGSSQDFFGRLGSIYRGQLGELPAVCLRECNLLVEIKGFSTKLSKSDSLCAWGSTAKRSFVREGGLSGFHVQFLYIG